MLYRIDCEERIVASSEYIVEAEDEKNARSILMHDKRKFIVERINTIEETIHIKKIVSIKMLSDVSN